MSELIKLFNNPKENEIMKNSVCSRQNLKYFKRFLKFSLKAFLISTKELFLEKYEGGIKIPGPILRYRVQNKMDRKIFLEVGRTCAANIEDALISIGTSMKKFNSILDLGCGCGRTLRHFGQYFSKADFHGCDINQPLIMWCQKNIPSASFIVNDPLPPLPYKTGQFDLIYLISVFTHLDEEYQDKWLQELKRITKKDGIVIISTHGEAAFNTLTPQQLEIINQKGSYFYECYQKTFRPDGLPNFYQASFHTRDYIFKKWSKYFQILKFIERGITDYQDLVVLQNSSFDRN